jgi:predicted methyltransferase
MSRCPTCQGQGRITFERTDDLRHITATYSGKCEDCNGTGIETEKTKDLRDEFAAAALSNYRLISCNEAAAAADWAYTYADAMMERRKR